MVPVEANTIYTTSPDEGPGIYLPPRPPEVKAETADPNHINQEINTWYHSVDLMLRDYIGQPELPNWATFGKYVSHNAGQQLKDLDHVVAILTNYIELKQALDDGLQLTVAELKLVCTSIASMTQHLLGLTWNNLGRVSDFWTLAEGTRELLLVIDQKAKGRAVSLDAEALKSADSLSELTDLFSQHHLKLREILQRLGDALRSGNRKIYTYMRTNVARFFEAVAKNPADPLSCVEFIDDQRGFFKAAFKNYHAAQKLALQMQQRAEESQDWTQLNQQRMELVRKANLYLVFNEQSSRVQPLYDQLLAEVDAITNEADLRDPAGVFRLLPLYRSGNWAEIYTRMGIDPLTAPKNHHEVSPESFPKLLNPNDPRYAGTIAAYFERALTSSSICARLREAPSSCLE